MAEIAQSTDVNLDLFAVFILNGLLEYLIQVWNDFLDNDFVVTVSQTTKTVN